MRGINGHKSFPQRIRGCYIDRYRFLALLLYSAPLYDRKIVNRIVYATAVLCLIAYAAPQDSVPVPERMVQPEWGPELEKDFLTSNVKVELIVDAHGVPFAVSSQGGIPDSVVLSLEKWRFRPAKKDGKDTAASVVLDVIVRRPLSPASVRAIRRRWLPPNKALMDALKEGPDLDAGALVGVKRVLDADPQNANERTRLIAYGAAKPSDPERAKLRVENIAWLVENQPAAPVLASPLAALTCTPSAELCDRLRSLWSSQLEAHPADPLAIEHATNFLRLADPVKAEAAIMPLVRTVDSAGVWLGDLYGLAALGVTAINPQTGAASAAAEKIPDDAFAKKARAALGRATSLRIVFAGLNAIADGGRSLAKSGGHVPGGYAALCGELLHHARELYSGTTETCATSGEVESPTVEMIRDADRIRVGGNIQASTIKKRVQPVYPAEAKSRRIQGAVHFNVVIDKEGKVQSLILTGGPFALYKAARDAVSRWEYRPTTLNGRPVEVITTIDVNFQLF